LSYSWNGPDGFTSVNQHPNLANATSLNSGTYFLSVTDIHGCTSNSSADVVVNNCVVTLNLKLFIEGYYMGGNHMWPVLLDEVVFGATGNETDTIFVELHSAVNSDIVVEAESVF